MKKTAEQILFYACLVLVWQLLVALRIWPPYLLPSPAMVLEALWYGFADRTFVVGVSVSMRRIALGYAASVVMGVALGFLIATSEFLERTVGKLVLGLQSLPSICWLPLAVLWFGLSENAILFVVLMGSVLAVAINTEIGVRHVPRIYLLAGKNMGAHGIAMFSHILLPASMPHLIAGLKQGWAFAWRSLISGEMIFVSLGLGHLLMMGRDLNDMSQVMAVMLLIMLLGVTVDRTVFHSLEKRIQRKWGLARPA
ncbi:MAG: ABC transporter permease [Acidobacteria bacterium]|nr:ABC transporter permease [Acidobacteriota bacterium]